MPFAGSFERAPQVLDLHVSTDEPGEALYRGGTQPRAEGFGPDQLVGLDRIDDPLQRHGPERCNLDEALGEPEGVRGDECRAWASELLHASGQMSGLTHRRVVHVEIAADRADDDLARIESDANLDIEALAPPELFGVALDRVLHPHGRVAGAHRVIFVRQWRAEQRHDAITEHLVDGTLIAMHGLHHALQHRVEKAASLLGVAVGEELHRPLQVREQDRDLLAFPFDGLPGVEDLLDEMGGRIGEGGARKGTGVWRGFVSSGPHQHLAVLIGGDAPREYDFGSEIFEVIVVEIEAALERPVGDPALTLEKFEDLGQQLLERHRAWLPLAADRVGRPLHGRAESVRCPLSVVEEAAGGLNPSAGPRSDRPSPGGWRRSRRRWRLRSAVATSAC